MESLLKEVGTRTLGTCIDKRHATVAKWVALRPILEVCDRETGYEGGAVSCVGGKRRLGSI